MAPNISSLDRLKSQLQTTGLQTKNFQLFQLLNQLIDFLRLNINATSGQINAIENDISVLPTSSTQVIIGTPYYDSGSEGEDGPPGPPGRIGIDGLQGSEGSPGMPGIDGEDGIDGEPGTIGPQGNAGAKGDIGFAGSSGLDGLEGEQGEWGIPGPPGLPGPVGGTSGKLYWLDITDASDIAGYKKALSDPSTNPQVINTTACAGVGDNLIAVFVTEPGVPGAFFAGKGAGFRHIHGDVTTVAGSARYKVENYYCNADGTAETFIDQAYSDTLAAAGAVQEVDFDQYRVVNVPLAETMRLVYKLYVARVAGPANINVDTYFEGLVNPSYLQSTVVGGTIGPPGPIGQIGPPGLSTPTPEPEEPLEPMMIPGPQGRAVQIYEQALEPTQALPGDFWIEP